MFRRWARGLLMTVVASFVVVASLRTAAEPFAALMHTPTLNLDLGAVHIEVGL